MITIQDLLNLATPTPSPTHCNTNIATIPTPTRPSSDSSSPSQQAQPTKTSSPQSPTPTPMELFHTPPTSPLPYLETLEDLSPKSSSPPSLSLFDTIAQMETQQQPSEQLDDEPHQPSLVERLAYRYARLSIFSNDQGHTHSQSFVFHPIYKDLHSNPSGEPSFRHFVQNQQPPQQQQPSPEESSQQFESLLSSYKKIEASIWEKPPNLNNEIDTHLNHLHAFKHMVDSQINHIMVLQTTLHSTNEGSKNITQPSTFAPSSSNHPPPTYQTTLPPNFPRHDCNHCERTAHISKGCRREIRELSEEIRFILNHILDHLQSLSHPPQP